MISTHKAVSQVSIMILVVSICFGWFAFPYIFKRCLKKKINLGPETTARNMWESFPLPFDFYIHVFNVTNPNEIQNGAKPIVKDVGPFVFDEFKDKFDIQDNKADDSVSFNMRNTYMFRADKSEELTGGELITMPHPIIQMMAISVNRQSPETIKIVAKGLKIIFKKASPFITAPFIDLFFRGIFIDCSDEDLAAKAVCGQFESGTIRGVKQFNETHFKFALMGESNHTNICRFTVLRGERNANDVGKVIQVNGQSELNIWATGGQCNKLKGTDGTIFPPFMDSAVALWSYSPELCRSMAPTYKRKLHHDGIPATRFMMDFGDIRNENENACFCALYPIICPAKGTMDISPCTKTPMIASMPHFLNADKSLLKNIEGLQPCDNKHTMHFDIETLSGTPLSFYKRIQFNLDVEPVAEVRGMENMTKLVMPLFWIDENFNLVPPGTNQLLSMFTLLLIIDLFKWIALIAAFIGFAIASYLYGRKKIRHMIGPIN